MSLPWPYNRWTKSTYIFINISKADGEGEEVNADKYGSNPGYPAASSFVSKKGRSEELQELYENASGDV